MISILFISIFSIPLVNQVIGQVKSSTTTEIPTYIIPDMDTHVQENNPSVQWYRETCMVVDGDSIGNRQEIYIHFNVELGYWSSTYRFYFSFVSWSNATIYIFEVDNNWDEETITYESKPSQIRLINTINLDGSYDKRYEIKIDDLGLMDEISFGIIGLLDCDYSYIYSSDQGCLRYIPYIKVIEDIESKDIKDGKSEDVVPEILSYPLILLGVISLISIIYLIKKQQK